MLYVTERQSRTYVALGERLRAARGDLRQSEVADRVGVSPSYISLLERGYRRPETAVLRRYAEEFRLEYNELAALVDYADTRTPGAPLYVPDEVRDDLREMAQEPPALVRAAREWVRNMRILMLEERPPDRRLDQRPRKAAEGKRQYQADQHRAAES